MNVKKEWHKCPICDKKTVMIDPSKNIEGVYVKCKLCKREIEVIHRATN